MKCPYCAEQIKDDAVVCRHCGHDFSLIKPLVTRLISLEKKVAMFDATTAMRLSEAARFHTLAASIAVAVCVILTSGFLFVNISPPPPLDNPNLPKVLAIVLPPIALGLVLGAVWNRRSLRAYLLAGLSLGLVNLLCIWLIITSLEGAVFRRELALLTFALGQPLTFATSALVGNALRSRWSPPSTPSGGVEDDTPFERTTKKLSVVLGILLQLLAIVGTLASAFKMLGDGQS